MSSKLKILMLISTLGLCSISARADSIITGGTVSLSRTVGTQVTNMNFGGAGFSVSAIGRTAGFVSSHPCGGGCSANSLLNLSAVAGFWTFTDLTGGMNINGTNYIFVTDGLGPPNLPGVWGSGGLSFTAGSVLIPATNDPIITLTSTFMTIPNFSDLGGRYNGGSVGTGRLFGVGYVTVTLRLFTPGEYIADGATYTFVEPTPEPATLILLGSGVLVIIGAKLRRR